MATMLATTKEFPPSQNVGNFSFDQMLECPTTT
jgi:hypothetical protein